jgi:hypothetical protein
MVKLSKKLISVIIILSFILESSGSSFFFHAKDASDKSALRPLSVFNFQKKTLAELEEKCKACESLMAGVYMSEVATLDNAYIIDTGASPGGKQYPVPIKVVNDSKSPMRRNIVYAETWGQAVLVPVDMGIDIYADRAKDCPKLIMRLKDKDGRAYILLEHVRSDNIDTEIINLVGHLEKMNMSAQEIAFYPRDDSERKVADSVLNSYLGRQIKIKVRDGDSKDESTARTLVTDKGYIVMSDSNNHIIDSGLWADGGAGIETALEEAPVSSPSAAKAHVAEKSGRKEGDGISKQLQALGNPIFFIDRKSPKGAIRTNDEVVSALARHGFKKAGVLDNDDYGYLLVFEDKRGKEYVLRSAAGVETTVYYLARVLGFEDINGVSIFILDRAGAGQEAFALMEFYDGETFSTRKLGGPGFDSELYRKNPKLRDLTLKGLDLHAWMKMLADPAQIVRSDLFNILIGDFDADEPNNLMYRKPETKAKK